MNKLLERLHFDKYVNVYVIFALDMAVSIICSMLALMGLSLLFPSSSDYTLPFLAEWFIAGIVGIGVLFYTQKTYYAVIRHSNLREIANLTISAVGKMILIAFVVFAFPQIGF